MASLTIDPRLPGLEHVNCRTSDDGLVAVGPVDKTLAGEIVERYHYLHRRPPNSYSYGLFIENSVEGVVIFGIPASRHMQQSVCPDDPDLVIELNRLWVDDKQPRNTESFFVSRALKMLPPRIVVSYADTEQGHVGTIYRALNFNYAGWTDMDRKTPRYDYVVPNGLHSRDAYRGNGARWLGRVRRKPKARYWTTTGNRREKARLASMCRWPVLDWREWPVPNEHQYAPVEVTA